MKIPVTLACASALLATAAALGDHGIKIPGDNPLYHCQGDIADDQVDIKSVTIAPNPPVMGEELVITASGTVKSTIEKGATVHLVVKMGFITLVNKDVDLCDQVSHVDLECPIVKGDMVLTKNVTLPAPIPQGPFVIQADAKTKDGKRITCLEGQVSVQSSIFNEL